MSENTMYFIWTSLTFFFLLIFINLAAALRKLHVPFHFILITDLPFMFYTFLFEATFIQQKCIYL